MLRKGGKRIPDLAYCGPDGRKEVVDYSDNLRRRRLWRRSTYSFLADRSDAVCESEGRPPDRDRPPEAGRETRSARSGHPVRFNSAVRCTISFLASAAATAGPFLRDSEKDLVLVYCRPRGIR